MSGGFGNAAQVERRIARRYPMDCGVEIEWGSSVLLARARDISRSGMFLSTPESLWVGASFAVKLLMETPMRFDCAVRRVEPTRGVGVQITACDETTQTLLSDLLTFLERRR